MKNHDRGKLFELFVGLNLCKQLTFNRASNPHEYIDNMYSQYSSEVDTVKSYATISSNKLKSQFKIDECYWTSYGKSDFVSFDLPDAGCSDLVIKSDNKYIGLSLKLTNTGNITLSSFGIESISSSIGFNPESLFSIKYKMDEELSNNSYGNNMEERKRWYKTTKNKVVSSIGISYRHQMRDLIHDNLSSKSKHSIDGHIRNVYNINSEVPLYTVGYNIKTSSVNISNNKEILENKIKSIDKYNISSNGTYIWIDTNHSKFIHHNIKFQNTPFSAINFNTRKTRS